MENEDLKILVNIFNEHKKVIYQQIAPKSLDLAGQVIKRIIEPGIDAAKRMAAEIEALREANALKNALIEQLQREVKERC